MALNRSFVAPQSTGFAALPVVTVSDSLFFISGEFHNSLTLKAKEPEFLFIYATTFNITNRTALALKLTDPYGVPSIIPSERLTAPAIGLVTGDPARPSLDGGTYMQFSTTKTDFTVSGVWKVQGMYIKGAIERPGDAVYFVVGDSFYG